MRNQPNQASIQEQNEQFLGILAQEQYVNLLSGLAQKIHTNMLGAKLEETHEEVSIIHPQYYPAQIPDGQYLSLLQFALGNSGIKKQTIEVIKKFCDEKANINNVFESEQAKELKEISPKIKHQVIRTFFENELSRLSKAGVQPEQIEIKQDGLTSPEALALQKKVNALIGLDESDRRFPLDKDKFSMLIREYTNDINEIMKNPKNHDVKSRNLERTAKIATLIAHNQESLIWLQENDIETTPELISDVIKFMHAMSYKGDIRSFKISEDKLGEKNLTSTLHSIPLEKKSLEQSFDGQITLNGIISIIKKRADATDRTDSADWKKLYKKFNDFFERKKQLISEIKEDGPAARSTQVRGATSPFEEARGAKSGPDKR
jgi:hypothetical protein